MSNPWGSTPRSASSSSSASLSAVQSFVSTTIGMERFYRCGPGRFTLKRSTPAPRAIGGRSDPDHHRAGGLVVQRLATGIPQGEEHVNDPADHE